MLARLLRLDAVEPYRDYAAVFIRLAVGFHLVYGTQDNVFHYERMLEFARFLAAHGFPFPLFNAHLSAYAQFVCGLLFILGAATRPAAVVMVINFVVALVMVHVGKPYPQNAPAIFMLAGALFLLLNGAGRLSVDAWLAGRGQTARSVAPAGRTSRAGGGAGRHERTTTAAAS
jgi:putative oxidoreductase